MNSCVPKLFGSITPPQFGLSVTARAPDGPMPLRQWYSSAKQPPGQRTFGTLSALSAATTSLRMPRVFGIGEPGADPDALVNAVAKVFGELAEDIAVDLRAGFGHVHGQLDRLVRERNPGPARADQNQADDEQANGGRESEDHVCFSEYVT